MTTPIDEHRSRLMEQWLEAMRQQHLSPVLLLSVDVNNPENTALMITEGIDDSMLVVVLAELSKRMRREAAANSHP